MHIHIALLTFNRTRKRDARTERKNCTHWRWTNDTTTTRSVSHLFFNWFFFKSNFSNFKIMCMCKKNFLSFTHKCHRKYAWRNEWTSYDVKWPPYYARFAFHCIYHDLKQLKIKRSAHIFFLTMIAIEKNS